MDQSKLKQITTEMLINELINRDVEIYLGSEVMVKMVDGKFDKLALAPDKEGGGSGGTGRIDIFKPKKSPIKR